jgi:hypothetical protein
MKTKRYLKGILMPLFFLLTLQIQAQFPIVTSIGNYTVPAGQAFAAPVQVNNAAGIASFSLSLYFNPAVLNYNGYSQQNAALAGGFFVANCLPGNFKAAWFSINPATLANQDTLFNILFTCNGGSCNLIWDTLVNGAGQYSNMSGTILPGQFVNGSVNGGTPPGTCTNSISYTTAGMSLNFSGSATGTGPVSYYWYFGDGWVDTAQNPTHTYQNVASYTVTLATLDSLNCYTVSTLNIPASVFNLQMYGDVYSDTLLDAGNVYLYYKPFSPPTNTFNLIDSLQITGSYIFPGLLPGTYIVKAQPDSNSLAITNYIPTYYGNTPYWNTATNISTNALSNPYDIHLIFVPGPVAGPGNISGIISNGFKVFSSGTPAVGVEILLTNNTNQVIAVCYSDNLGQFSFNNIAYGTYKVRAEVTSIPVVPTTVVLSPTIPAVTNLSYVITPNGITTSTLEQLPVVNEISVTLFPNPANDYVNLDLSTPKSGNIVISIVDIYGRTVKASKHQVQKGNNHLIYETTSLRPGIYVVRIESDMPFSNNRILNIVK